MATKRSKFPWQWEGLTPKGKFVSVLREFKHGRLLDRAGRPIRKRKQALAIAFSAMKRGRSKRKGG